jgi:hypothetical protein
MSLFGQRKSVFGLGPVGQEAAGLPAHSLLGMQGQLVGVGEGSTSIRRWVDRLLTACFTKSQRS